jgi:DNA (cytosine-5)-methyltransferase 1
MLAASLFSGIGAPEVAMPGWTWLWHAEVDPFASAVMAARHPQSVNLGDVAAPDFAERAIHAGRPDVVVFGSPCQSFSVAGQRRGLADPRGDLALVALRVLQRVRPHWLCFENVPGLLSNADGADFGTFLRAVAECGYLGVWRVLDAQFAGVPQRRRRVFFVGHLGDWRPAAEILLEPASLRWNPPPRREAGQRVARPVAACADGGSGYRNDADTADNLVAGTLNSSIGRGTGGAHETDFLFADLRNGDVGDRAQTMQSSGAHGERGLSLNSLPHVVGPLAANGGTERKHGYGMGQQDWESGYAVPVAHSQPLPFDPRQVGHPANFSNPRAGDPCHPLRGVANAEPAIVTHALRADGFDASEDGTGRGTPLVPTTFIHPRILRNSQSSNQIGIKHDDLSDALTSEGPGAVSVNLRGRDGGGTAELGGEQATALRASQGGGDKSHVLTAYQCQGTNVGEAGTLRSGNGRLTGGTPFVAFRTSPNCGAWETGDRTDAITTNSDPSAYLVSGGAMMVRRLTPRECERLQGLPDDFTLISYRGKPAADGPRYKAIGNSMAVPVIRWILERLEKRHTSS